MSKYGELLDLVQELIENTTNLSADDIKDKAYEYYTEGLIDSTQYDHVLNTLDEF